MPKQTTAADTPPPPHWLQLVVALRWPGAAVLSAALLAIAAMEILKQPLPVVLQLEEPLPVRLEGGVRVEHLELPTVSVKAEETLPVLGTVELNKAVAVQGSVDVESIQQPLTLGAVSEPLQVSAPEALPINGTVTVEKIGGTIQTQTRVNPLPELPLP